MRPAVIFRLSMLCHPTACSDLVRTKDRQSRASYVCSMKSKQRPAILPEFHRTTLFADIGFDNAYTLGDFTIQLVSAYARWVLSSFARRVTSILECYFGQGLILTLPSQGVYPGHRIPVPWGERPSNCPKVFLNPPIDSLGCSLRVVLLATFKLSFCNSCPLVQIETGIEIPLVVAWVLDPECSLRWGQVSPIFLETLIRSGLDHLLLFSRLISGGYLAGLSAFNACALCSAALLCQRSSCR